MVLAVLWCVLSVHVSHKLSCWWNARLVELKYFPAYWHRCASIRVHHFRLELNHQACRRRLFTSFTITMELCGSGTYISFPAKYGTIWWKAGIYTRWLEFCLQWNKGIAAWCIWFNFPYFRLHFLQLDYYTCAAMFRIYFQSMRTIIGNLNNKGDLTLQSWFDLECIH